MKYRLFAALELPRGLQGRLSEVQATFAEQLPERAVRWVQPDGIHLTLKFYGDVRGEMKPEFEAGLQRSAQAAGMAAAATPLMLRGLGIFPNPARPQVIWVGLEGDLGPLQHLRRAVEAEAETLGYPPDDRPFTPHLTLGRVRAGLHWADQQLLLDCLRRARVDNLGEFQPAMLSLMSSDRRPTGAVYTALRQFPLNNKETASGNA